MDKLKAVGKIIWDVVESGTFALAIFVVAYLFLFQPTEVRGMSSYPTVQPNEKVIAEKISYRFYSPERGDFVILESPNNPDVDFIKRIIGLPGETIRISQGKVFINGESLAESYVTTKTYPESYLPENQEYLIPDGHFFVMGDNREHSSDSRDFGPVSARKIVGKVLFRFWPPDRFGMVE